jgi:DNA modification methylase
MIHAAWPADRVERRAIGALVPYARNARTHSDAQVAQIAASIREWGWTTPVLIDGDGILIAGHGRVLAAQQLGILEVPVMVASGWSKAQIAAYRLADNKLALNAGWDSELLRLELGELDLGGFDLALTGFGSDELAGLLGSTEGLTDPDDVPEVQEAAVTVAGDVWLLGRHRLLCGDSTDADAVAAVLAGVVRPHLMVTDPPYGVEYDANWRNVAKRAGGKAFGAFAVGKVENDTRIDWSEAWALFPGDVAYVWHAGVFAAAVADSLTSNGFEIRSQIIWAKNSHTISRGHYHWQHEPCWYAVRENATGHWVGDRSQMTLWPIDKHKSETGHSTQKPVECMKRPIENNSSPGQAVYEPFSGSGTTIIAAEMTGRCAYAIEISPQYCDVAVRRWQAFTGQQAVLERTGRTFAETANFPTIKALDVQSEAPADRRTA